MGDRRAMGPVRWVSDGRVTGVVWQGLSLVLSGLLVWGRSGCFAGPGEEFYWLGVQCSRELHSVRVDMQVKRYLVLINVRLISYVSYVRADMHV
ncbi:unnamed protein product [Calypogeia fissa]